uniref:Uncharacterized protein n=1 Tax=viral metagenome TaxID=1070528 RepID=A0A6H1ZN46_9ZZZZ
MDRSESLQAWRMFRRSPQWEVIAHNLEEARNKALKEMLASAKAQDKQNGFNAGMYEAFGIALMMPDREIDDLEAEEETLHRNQ